MLPSNERRGLRSVFPALNVSPTVMIAFVVCIGAIDGVFRAYNGLPTVYGEKVEWAHEATELEQISTPIDFHDPGDTSMLLQMMVGGACTFSWNCKPGLICNSGVCAPCTNDQECILRNSKNRCQNNTALDAPVCRHKPLFSPFDNSDVIISIITFFTIVLAAPAGVGGGGVLVPMYLAVGHFSPHYGIPLSKATIFGGAVSNNFYNLQKRHPYANRPLIDYITCMMLEPVLLLGTILGVFFNAVSPGWAITLLLVVTLLWTTYRTSLKAYDTYLKEEANSEDAEAKRLLPPTKVVQHSSFNEDQNMSPEMRQIVESESGHNLYAIGILCISWVLIAAFSLLKGGEGGAGIYPCGSLGYWILVLTPAPIIAFMVWYLGNKVNAVYERKVELGFEFCDGDLHWNKRNVRVFPLYCISAGFAAGALGIAAGTILGPVLLELGMMPIVATTSSGFMVIFTSSSTTFQFLVMGQLQIDYALFFAMIGLIGGAIGNSIVSYIVKKYHKTWFVVAILAFVLALSCFMMGYAGYVRASIAYSHGKNMGFRHLCPIMMTSNLAKAVAAK